DPRRVAEYPPGYALLDRLDEAQAAPPCQWRLQRANTGHQGAYLERPGIQRQATRLQPGDVERIVEQPQQVGAGLADRLGATPLARIQRPVEQQFAHAHHAGDRRAHLVAEVGEELAAVHGGPLDLAATLALAPCGHGPVRA